MHWTLFFTSVLICLVAGDGAWERNREYKYKLRAKTLTALPRSNNQWVGAIFRGRLSILPQSVDRLIGEVSQAEYAEVQLSDGWYTHLDDSEIPYKPWLLSKPFEIHMRDGVIYSLSVDRAMTNDQINQLKVIVSQFQINTNDKNDIEGERNNAFYKIMEQTVSGNCETIYEIGPISTHLKSGPSIHDSVQNLKKDGQFIDIVKTRNYSNCDERIGFMNLLNINQMENGFHTISHFEISRVILFGSRKNYSIQSAVTTTQVVPSPASRDSPSALTIYYVDVKLESIEQTTRRLQILSRNLSNIGNLMFTGLNVTSELRQGTVSSYELLLSINGHWAWAWNNNRNDRYFNNTEYECWLPEI